MIDTVKNLLLASIGAAVLTKDKAMSFMEQSVAQGKLSAEEAEKLADEVVAESKRQAKAWGDKASEAADNAVSALNLAKREELAALEKRVAQLEAEVKDLKGGGEKG